FVDCYCHLPILLRLSHVFLFAIFFFHHPATTEIYTLSLHDALPICQVERDGQRITQIGHTGHPRVGRTGPVPVEGPAHVHEVQADRKSTRLNSSHVSISYAVFCLKKKK